MSFTTIITSDYLNLHKKLNLIFYRIYIFNMAIITLVYQRSRNLGRRNSGSTCWDPLEWVPVEEGDGERTSLGAILTTRLPFLCKPLFFTEYQFTFHMIKDLRKCVFDVPYSIPVMDFKSYANDIQYFCQGEFPVKHYHSANIRSYNGRM